MGMIKLIASTADTPYLFRAHQKKYLKGATGVIPNPNLQRSREPRDMPIIIHRALCEWFTDRFGIDYRGSSLFCTGDARIASGYLNESSSLISIEPIEDYSLCFSAKCKDLFGYYQFNWRSEDISIRKIHSDLDGLDFIHYENTGLKEASLSGSEVMLVAKNFRYRQY